MHWPKSLPECGPEVLPRYVGAAPLFIGKPAVRPSRGLNRLRHPAPVEGLSRTHLLRPAPGRVYNRRELVGLQAGAADQRAIDLRLAEELFGIRAMYAAAVLDTHALRDCGIGH